MLLHSRLQSRLWFSLSVLSGSAGSHLNLQGEALEALTRESVIHPLVQALTTARLIDGKSFRMISMEELNSSFIFSSSIARGR